MANFARPSKVLSKSILMNYPYYIYENELLQLKQDHINLSEYYAFLHLTSMSNPLPLCSQNNCIMSKIPLETIIPLLAKECLVIIAINLNVTCVNYRSRRDNYVHHLLQNLPLDQSDIIAVFKPHSFPDKRLRENDIGADGNERSCKIGRAHV